ncbi:SRPBCC family protein [Chelativorans sp. YIM 93263]|uniref:SRPBCC family protein n=1 Tax=Chelativorans sp. YIM 93263 TaxID=2906648 RepID=UPI00237973D3|nr:SRPBCC family protein [Chelativorans sp. YIM 93263]
MHHRHHEYRNGRAIAAVVLGTAAGVAILAVARKGMRKRTIVQPEDSPRRLWRRTGAVAALVGRTVTINRPREEVYARWRDFARFPEFMENVRSVTPIDRMRSRWVIEAPAGSSVTFETKITEERENELIAWETDADSEVSNSGRVLFRDAPGGRGTQVEATIAYEPPAGAVGRAAAKVMQREPQIQVRRELRRFKQLMETGEIATAATELTAPRA